MQAVREYVELPSHIRVCANMIYYDLTHGPAFARIPAAGIEAITDDHLATIRSDAEDECEPGDRVVEVYTGPIADALRAFIDDLPSTLYVDDDAECVMDTEPQGEEIDGEWCEPTPYFTLEGRTIVEAVFGPTIAREFR
jgi:hypothetical protein